MADKASHVGLKQAHRLIGMPYQKRMDFIAKGLPLILERAQKLYEDSEAISESPMSAAILVNAAKEEAAKILILMDVIRCPKKRIARDIKSLMKWYYDHLARLIYADSGTWKPQDIPDLKRIVDIQRKSHHLDGNVGEYIFPNMAIYQRELQLYVDVAIHDEEEPIWVSPLHDGFTPWNTKPLALAQAEAMKSLGLFEPKGLSLIAKLWNTVDFCGDVEIVPAQDWGNTKANRPAGFTDSHRLMQDLFTTLQQAGRTDDKSINAMRHLNDSWQYPMYDFDMSSIIVTHDELKEEQEVLLAYEMGC